MYEQQLVRNFHDKFGVHVGETPLMTDAAFRSSLILEEAVETVVAAVGSATAYEMLVAKLAELRSGPYAQPDFAEAVDGLCDSVYVNLGAAVHWGVNLAPVFDEVHRANMTKEGGPTRPDGKILKPAGWTPPDIEGELRKQGWKP